ncbi:hypothetical protein KAI52_01125 [Candidatus Parcubacteria bacterium]|nr:hypothetical protein [Candidatus Parcubacteria bacterium]
MEIDFFINTENEDINATEGKILFPAEFLILKKIKDGNSIVNFWVERPIIKHNNKIIFAGIIPGGYVEKRGYLFSVVFQAKKQGTGIIKIDGLKILLNDGSGSETGATAQSLQFSVSPQTAEIQEPKPKITDNEPPELFKPMIAKDLSIFDNKYFLVFAAQDKGSGIDYYKVREGERSFVIAKSPYLLQNQNLNEKIIVKAIDKTGNERIAIISFPKKQRLWYENYLLFAILLLVIFIICFALNKFIKNVKN